MDERDASTPLTEAFPRPSELLNERDPQVVRKPWGCKNGHSFVVEGTVKPSFCPECLRERLRGTR